MNEIETQMGEALVQGGAATPKEQTPPETTTPGTAVPPANPDAGTETTPPAATHPEENSTIKQLRTGYSEKSKEAARFKTTLEKMAASRGLGSIEELEEALQREADESEAKKVGVSPEIQAKIRQLEEAQQKVIQEKQEELFTNRFNKLVETNKISEEDASKFVRDAHQKGFDLLGPNVDFNAVYFALNQEKIIAKVREEARQQVLDDIKNQKIQAPGITKGGGSQGDGKKTVEDLYKDLKSGIFK